MYSISKIPRLQSNIKAIYEEMILENPEHTTNIQSQIEFEGPKAYHISKITDGNKGKRITWKEVVPRLKIRTLECT